MDFGADRHIAHLDQDSFFVSVERLRNSKLIGIPVIVGGETDRGVVAACSHESRVFGVHSAMPIKLARRLCPQAIYLRPDMDAYSEYSDLVTEVVHSKAPLYEKASIDEHFIDLTGMDRFFGIMKWMKELRQTIITETGLPVSFGLSVNKTVSKIATDESKPNGELEVPYDRVLPFLSPLQVNKIPGVGPKTAEQLRRLGIVTIETLRQVPVKRLQSVLGEHGLSLHNRAWGIDTSPVQPIHERKSISKELTFNQDTIDVTMINELIITMCEQLCFQLRAENKLTSCVAVKIKYSNFEPHSMQKKISYTSLDGTILDIAKELFKKVYDKRMLIRLIGVKLTDLVGGTQQIDMFQNTTEQINLYQALDNIRKRFGEDAVMRSCGLNLKGR